MAKYKAAPAPEWVTLDPDDSEGLDFLGLRSPAQAVSNGLLDGITTVTKRVRYISLVAWMIDQYLRARLPNKRKSFEAYATSVETMLTLANVMRARSISMVGRNTANRRLSAQTRGPVALDRLVKNIAFNIYANVSAQLGVAFEPAEEGEVYGLSAERGAPLAAAISPYLARPSVQRLARETRPSSVTQAELRALSKVFEFDKLPTKERKLLRGILMPKAPLDAMERMRLMTYALLLWLGQSGEVFSSRVFKCAAEGGSAAPEVLQPAIDGWLGYCVRDALAVAHEFAFGAVMRTVDAHSNTTGAPAKMREVVAELTGDTTALSSALFDLKLLTPDEDYKSVSWCQMSSRIKRRCSNSVSTRAGVRRWRGGLDESKLMTRIRRDRGGAVALLPVAWELARLRIDAEDPAARNLLETGGATQIGIGDVVLPRLRRYERDNPRFTAVVEDLLLRAVDQHLNTAWDRMARGNGKDISVLIADLDEWSRRAPFKPGQTDSRLDAAISWLEQLGLVSDGHTTSQGAAELKACLNALETSSNE